MSKKRAFVRYTKSGEIVPGSLIITTNGGYPDKSSLWKEVTVDQCCPDDGGGNCCESIEPIEVIYEATTYTGGIFIRLDFFCFDNTPNTPAVQFSLTKGLTHSITTPPTFFQMIDLINQYFNESGITASIIDEFNALITITNPNFYSCACEGSSKQISVFISEPALPNPNN